MEHRVEYRVKINDVVALCLAIGKWDPFREVFYLEKSVYDQDGNTVHQINILAGDDYKNIRKTEKLAAELAESEPGSSAWSCFNESGYFEVHLRKLWPKEEE